MDADAEGITTTRPFTQWVKCFVPSQSVDRKSLSAFICVHLRFPGSVTDLGIARAGGSKHFTCLSAGRSTFEPKRAGARPHRLDERDSQASTKKEQFNRREHREHREHKGKQALRRTDAIICRVRNRIRSSSLLCGLCDLCGYSTAVYSFNFGLHVQSATAQRPVAPQEAALDRRTSRIARGIRSVASDQIAAGVCGTAKRPLTEDRSSQ